MNRLTQRQKDRAVLSAIEVAYSLDLERGEWLGGLARCVMPLLDRGFGTHTLTVDFRSDGHEVHEGPLVGGSAAWREVWKQNWWEPLILRLDTPSLYGMLKQDPVVSAQELWAAAERQSTSLDAYLRELSLQGWSHAFHRGGGEGEPRLFYVDSLNVFALDRASGRCACLVVNRAEPITELERDEARRALAPLVPHLKWAQRARAKLEKASAFSSAEAILTPEAKVLHATGKARSTAARDALRAAVKGREYARSGRGEADALRVVPGLVDGRWTIVDTFDLEGRRYVVALPNDASSVASELTAREREVVELIGRGLSNKEVAFTLGVSVGTVGALLHRCTRKLGVSSRVELISRTRRS